MQSPDNVYTAPTAFHSKYPELSRNNSLNDTRSLDPYSTENSKTKSFKSVLVAGHPTRSSSSDSNSLDSLSYTQVPLSSQAQAKCLSQKALPVTVLSATVTSNNPQFRGDFTFPSIRPPIQELSEQASTASSREQERSRPDRVAAMNDAFKAWSSDMPNEPPPADLKRTWEGIHALLNSPPAANAPISTKQTEPPAEIVSGSAICDPASFRDPEHNVRTIVDCEEACSSKPPQKGRLLPKRGMNRRLTGMPAGGDDHTETITSQAHRFSADLSTGTCKSTRHIPSNTISKVEATLQVTLSQLTPPPQQNTQVQSTLPQLTPLPQQRTPAQVTARPSRMESRVSIYDQRRQPETGAILPGMEVDSRIPFTTPIDVKVIDLVLDGRATVENQVIWLTRQIECVQGMWTLPNQALVRVLQTRQVVSQEQTTG